MASSLPQFLSVRRWMNCSHLPTNARTRWVTERIASLSTGSARTRVRNQTDEMTGSKGALQNGFLRQQCQTDLKKKLGTKTFLPVDIRPNGRPHSRTDPIPI